MKKVFKKRSSFSKKSEDCLLTLLGENKCLLSMHLKKAILIVYRLGSGKNEASPNALKISNKKVLITL